MKKLFCVLFLSLCLSVPIMGQFKIVFVADPLNVSTDWLTKIATDWGATGVCLRTIWGDLDNNSSPGVDTWTTLDNSINAIINNQYNGKNLDIYIRVSMGVKKPTWVSPTSGYFTYDDFQTKQDGSILTHGSDPLNYHPLNFNSSTSQSYMNNFFTAVLGHIYNTFPSILNRIKEVVPSFSTDEESEYPYDEMCGYSNTEISAFRSYLQTIYSSPSILNNKWNPNNTWANITTWTDINPRNYYWNSSNNTNYFYPAGRTDWINFRTKGLTDFISAIKNIANIYNFQIGIQFGSIYDNSIENRGWIDPAKLIENVNSVHVADIYQYSDNFAFAADYLRSISKFWTVTNNMTSNPIRFSTETDWPYYNGQTASFLSQKWTDQLVSYYNKGANEHYIFGWDRSDLDYLKTDYSVWRQTLLTYSGQSIQNPSYQYVDHLGCEKVLFNNHNQQSSNGKFAIYDSLTAQPPYSSTWGNYDGNKDIITNYMIEENPTYLNRYNVFYLTKMSQYITEKAYASLMKSAITISYANATWFSDGGHGEYAFTQGLYNEYRESRSPIHLIWRSRPDLMSIWPDANLPAPGSGWTSDFVNWAYYNGCGYANQPTAREYPGWEIRDNGSTGNYKYDKNLRAVWDQRGDLQSVFNINAHYSSNPSWNMISWGKQNGYSESSLLVGYNYWPYIGDNRTFYKISKTDVDNNNSLAHGLYSINNYPNPFNPTTVIKYQLPKEGFVSLKVFDMLGREVANLVNEKKKAGFYEVEFKASRLASGIYIYTIHANNFIQSKKMLLVK